MSVSQTTPALQALTDSHEPPLSAPLTLSFDYTRSVGPTLGAFFTALRDRRIVGVRGSDGRVHVPVVEYDPVTCERITEIVPVSGVGTVVSWTRQTEPLEGQPLDRPFTWALIKLDGADTALLHAVDGEVVTGDRVHAHWIGEPQGAITDIACFVPGEQPEPEGTRGLADDRDPVTMVVSPCSLAVQHSASRPESIYLRALRQGILLGARSGDDGKVYFPPREADPATGKELDQFVELPDTGTVTTFAIINIPFAGQKIKPPYVAAYILLDGADIPFLHLVTDVDAADVRMGMRVKAVWKPAAERDFGIDNIEHFRPTGEPDAEYDSYKHHL